MRGLEVARAKARPGETVTALAPHGLVDARPDAWLAIPQGSADHPGNLRRGCFPQGLAGRRIGVHAEVRFVLSRFPRWICSRFFPSIKTLHPLPCHRFDAKTLMTA
jgi:hypothetical protein